MISDKKRKIDPFCIQIEEIVFNHMKRMHRILPEETVERVQTYLGGLKILLRDSSVGMKTLYLVLGNQSSALFVSDIDSFLRDVALFCGKELDSICVVEERADFRNKEQCLSTVHISFGGKSLAEWSEGNGEGLRLEIMSRKPCPLPNNPKNAKTVKVLHIVRQEDGSSVLSIELPELVDLIEQAMNKNFNKPLIQWLHKEMRISSVTMDPHQELFQSVLKKLIARILNPESFPE